MQLIWIVYWSNQSPFEVRLNFTHHETKHEYIALMTTPPAEMSSSHNKRQKRESSAMDDSTTTVLKRLRTLSMDEFMRFIITSFMIWFLFACFMVRSLNPYNLAKVPWRSWLTRLLYTQKIPGSNPGGTISPFPFLFTFSHISLFLSKDGICATKTSLNSIWIWTNVLPCFCFCWRSVVLVV